MPPLWAAHGPAVDAAVLAAERTALCPAELSADKPHWSAVGQAHAHGRWRLYLRIHALPDWPALGAAYRRAQQSAIEAAVV